MLVRLNILSKCSIKYLLFSCFILCLGALGRAAETWRMSSSLLTALATSYASCTTTSILLLNLLMYIYVYIHIYSVVWKPFSYNVITFNLVCYIPRKHIANVFVYLYNNVSLYLYDLFNTNYLSVINFTSTYLTNKINVL